MAQSLHIICLCFTKVYTLVRKFVEKSFSVCHVIGRSKGGGARDAPPLWVQIVLFSCSFWEIFDQIIGWRPHVGGWRCLLWQILDPPLHVIRWTDVCIYTGSYFKYITYEQGKLGLENSMKTLLAGKSAMFLKHYQLKT